MFIELAVRKSQHLKNFDSFLAKHWPVQYFSFFTHCEAKKRSVDFDRIDEKYGSNEMYRSLVEYAQVSRIYTGLLYSDLAQVKDLSSNNQTLLDERVLVHILKMRHTFLEKVFNHCTLLSIPEYWFERTLTSSRLHTINANQPSSPTASNRSEQYDAASSTCASSQAP